MFFKVRQNTSREKNRLKHFIFQRIPASEEFIPETKDNGGWLLWVQRSSLSLMSGLICSKVCEFESRDWRVNSVNIQEMNKLSGLPISSFIKWLFFSFWLATSTEWSEDNNLREIFIVRVQICEPLRSPSNVCPMIRLIALNLSPLANEWRHLIECFLSYSSIDCLLSKFPYLGWIHFNPVWI